jgi:hypothetical protein
MSCTSRHASRWLTTFPRTPHHQLPNADFEVAVRLRLGAPLFDHAPSSCICKSDVSEQKSPGHMLVCKELRGVPLMQRHNIVVRTLVNAAMLAGVETRVEVTQPCLNEAFDEERELRPDVEINGGMASLVDVVVNSSKSLAAPMRRSLRASRRTRRSSPPSSKRNGPSGPST